MSGAVVAEVGGLDILGMALAVYFAPTIIAVSEGRRNTAAIVALNLVAGWTFVGWVGALVWAFIKDREEEMVVAESVDEDVVEEQRRQEWVVEAPKKRPIRGEGGSAADQKKQDCLNAIRKWDQEGNG